MLMPWFNCTSSMLMNVQLGGRCGQLCRTFLSCRNTDSVSHLYKHDMEPLHHPYMKRDLLKENKKAIQICMLNNFF